MARFGDPTPSQTDVKATRDLIRGGQLLKIKVLDHIVMGPASEGQKGYSCRFYLPNPIWERLEKLT